MARLSPWVLGTYMPDGKDSRDRVAYLRQLAIDSLKNYGGGFAELERVDQDLDSIIGALDDVADPSWTAWLRGQWGYLEATYASALAHGRYRLTQDEEVDLQGVVADLLAGFQDYELPLDPDEKPRENDVVRLVRPLPGHNLPADSRGTVVVDYTTYSEGTLPPEYEVQFDGPDGVSQTMLTVAGDDLKIVSRPGYGKAPS